MHSEASFFDLGSGICLWVAPPTINCAQFTRPPRVTVSWTHHISWAGSHPLELIGSTNPLAGTTVTRHSLAGPWQFEQLFIESLARAIRVAICGIHRPCEPRPARLYVCKALRSKAVDMSLMLRRCYGNFTLGDSHRADRFSRRLALVRRTALLSDRLRLQSPYPRQPGCNVSDISR